MSGSRGPLIREAGPSDVDAIVKIYLSNAAHHAALEPAAYRVPALEAVRDRFTRMLAEPDEEDAHFVAVVDGRVVGAIDAFRRPDGAAGSMRLPRRTAEFGIGVLEEWRGRGVGSALIAAVESWARDAGLDALVLEVADGNGDAWRLYERLGYRPATHQLERDLRAP